MILLAVDAVFGPGGQMVGAEHRSQQRGQHRAAGHHKSAEAAQLAPKNHQRPHRHGRVQQPEEQARAHEPQVRHEEQRKGHRHRQRQRAQAIEGQHLRHRLAQRPALAEVALEDAHHQRDLRYRQHGDHTHQPVQQHTKRPAGAAGQAAMGHEEQGPHEPADEPHQQLDAPDNLPARRQPARTPDRRPRQRRPRPAAPARPGPRG